MKLLNDLMLKYLFLALGFSVTGYTQSFKNIALTRKVGPQNGLSSYNANRIVQDRHGFIWIATQDGLNRYDGNVSLVYSKSSAKDYRLLGNVINNIELDDLRDMLWVTTSYGGLNGIDLTTGRVTHSLSGEISKDGFPNDWLKCFKVHHGLIWIGTAAGFKLYDPDRRRFIKTQLPKWNKVDTSLNVNLIFIDKFDHVWIFFSGWGFAVFSILDYSVIKQHRSSTLGIKERIAHLQFNSRLIPFENNSFIWGTDYGFKKIVYDDSGGILQVDSAFYLNKFFGDQIIYSCAMDRNKNIWFSTNGHLYYSKLEQGSFSTVADVSGLDRNGWLENTFEIFFDRDDNIWLGTQNGAAYALNKDPAFLPFFNKSGSKVSHTYSISPLNDSIVYLATQNGFFEANLHTEETTLLSKSLAFNFTFKIDHEMYVSGENGIFWLDKKKKLHLISAKYPELRPIENEILNSVVQYNDSIFILGSEKTNQVYLWDRNKNFVSMLIHENAALGSNIINTIYKDPFGRVFVLYDNAIGKIDFASQVINKFQILDADLKIPLSILLDITYVKNSYWIAVYGKGIIETDTNFRIKNTHSVPQGVTNTGVYKVLPYQDSLLFVTTNGGLFAIDLSKKNVRHYTTADGLNTNNFEENVGFIAKDEVFIGGADGFTKVVPKSLKDDQSSPVLYLTKIETTTKDSVFTLSYTNGAIVIIPNGSLQSKFHFTALKYSSFDFSFQYKIDELHTDWIDLGRQNFIDIIGLQPGKYGMAIRTADHNNKWSAQIDVSFLIQPKWYQTLFFKLLILSAVGLALYSIYLYRMRQLYIQQKIRQEIASDLHDDIGGTLNSAKVFTHLAKKKLQTEYSTDDYLQYAEESIGQATGDLRDIIWVLDDSDDTIQRLCERLVKFAAPLTVASEISFKFFIQPGLVNKVLTKKQKKNLFLIGKEVINNCIKYSKCGILTLEFTESKKQFAMKISDDGIGFDYPSVALGNGLKNIVKRARAIHFSCDIESIPEKGTIILISKV
jgi:signal transduction histidine kinase/ligand-binding sensor domain-containing protein